MVNNPSSILLCITFTGNDLTIRSINLRFIDPESDIVAVIQLHIEVKILLSSNRYFFKVYKDSPEIYQKTSNSYVV